MRHKPFTGHIQERTEHSMNDKNLIPFNKRSKSEARENGKKGGIKSGATRRKKRDCKKIAETIAAMKPSAYMVKKLEANGIKEGKADNLSAVVMAIVLKAQSGDINAARLFLQLLDQDPQLELKKQEITKKDPEEDKDIIINFLPASQRPKEEEDLQTALE